METSKLISTTNIAIYLEKGSKLSTNTSDLTKYRKVIPVESSTTKYPISTKFTLNIKTEVNIYYQVNQGMEVVLLYHGKSQEKQGTK